MLCYEERFARFERINFKQDLGDGKGEEKWLNYMMG